MNKTKKIKEELYLGEGKYCPDCGSELNYMSSGDGIDFKEDADELGCGGCGYSENVIDNVKNDYTDEDFPLVSEDD